VFEMAGEIVEEADGTQSASAAALKFAISENKFEFCDTFDRLRHTEISILCFDPWDFPK